MDLLQIWQDYIVDYSVLICVLVAVELVVLDGIFSAKRSILQFLDITSKLLNGFVSNLAGLCR